MQGASISLGELYLFLPLSFSALIPILSTSFHSGVTSGPVPVNFGQSARASYKESFIPMFSQFLQKCYSELFI